MTWVGHAVNTETRRNSSNILGIKPERKIQLWRYRHISKG
jgi:hypothetical protein